MVDKIFDTTELDELLEGEEIIAENISYANFLQAFAGRRTEWLMGYVIDLMTNVPKHNIIQYLLTYLFGTFMAYRSPGAMVLPAGVSMYLGDDKPAREPDLIILLPEHTARITESHLDGTGDIVVEIVSKESRHRDRVKKLQEYEAAGIPEYWLIDPLMTDAKVYVLQNGSYVIHPTDKQGRLQSVVLPGFVVHPELFWREKSPETLELIQLVQHMLNSGDNP
jgi:Uma2 family endonuclease